MSANEIIAKIEKEQLKSELTEFKVGDTVRVHNKIKEGNRERIQIFEGTVIAKKNGGISANTNACLEMAERCVERRSATVSGCR